MQLQLTNVGQAPIVVKDHEGYTDFAVSVAPSTTENVNVSDDLLQRLTPFLKALEVPTYDVDGTTVLVALRWGVVASAEDIRSQRAGLAGTPTLNEYQNPDYSTGGGETDIVATGTGLLGNQVQATLEIADAAAAMRLDLEAVNPGAAGNVISCEIITPASTLLVSVVANKITVRPATGGSTISAIVTAINAEADAKLLVQATEGVAGTLNEAVAEQWLSGGEGPGVSLSLNGTACVLTEVTDTQLTFDIPTGISTITYLVPLEYQNGPHKTRLTVPVVA